MTSLEKPLGLYNINGVTCYLNSTLQILFLCNKFNKEVINIDRNKYKNKLNYSTIMAYKSILNKLDNKYKILKLSVFVKKFQKVFGIKQQDAHEFLIYFLETITDEIKFTITDENIKNQLLNINYDNKIVEEIQDIYRDGYSIIDKYFNGLITKKITCNNCKNTMNKIEIFKGLEFGVNQVDNLNHAIENYFEPENLIDYKCEKCNQKNCVKKYNLLTTPKYLFIYFKKYTNRLLKINKNITFEKYISFLPYFVNNTKKKNFYKLKGVVNHSGNIYGGHYTSNVEMNQKWYKCDDTFVNEIPEQSINNQLAYLLLYEKIEEDVLNN
jgi:ubiquitin carboxyl-terminal hydrolase 2/21